MSYLDSAQLRQMSIPLPKLIDNKIKEYEFSKGDGSLPYCCEWIVIYLFIYFYFYLFLFVCLFFYCFVSLFASLFVSLFIYFGGVSLPKKGRTLPVFKESYKTPTH